MKLSSKQKEQVLGSLKEKYSISISITDSLDLQLDDKTYQTLSAINERIRILFVLFDGQNHNDKTTIVRRLIKANNYSIGHSVHYQFENNELLGIIISDEIN